MSLASLAMLSLARAEAASPAAGAVRRQVRFAISITNPLAEPLTDQVLWLYLPAAETPTQTLDKISMTLPYELSSDALGHSIVKLAFPHVAPLASRVITVVAEVTMRLEPRETALVHPQDWLVAERYLEVDDPAIQSLANDIKRPTARQTAEVIYDWTREHLQYAGYVPDDIGALEALRQRRGDCTEYAYLSVALARACGIPARMVGGHVIDASAVLRAEDYHNWAEVYLDGAWRLLDAQKERWLTPAEQYVAFRFYRDAAINPIGRAHRFRVQGALQVRL